MRCKSAGGRNEPAASGLETRSYSADEVRITQSELGQNGAAMGGLIPKTYLV